MSRTRRFAGVAVLALLGVLVLAGCGRAQPGTAAYVGDTRYTENQLDDLVDEVRRMSPNTQPSNARGWVLARLILGDLARQVATGQSISVPAVNYEESAQRLGLPTDSKLVRLQAEFDAVANALITRVQPVAPTEREFREIWETVRRDPRLAPGTTYEEVARILRNDENLPLALGVRTVLSEQARKTPVVVNPLYQPLIVNIGIGDVPLPMLLGDDSSVVSDLVTSG